MYDSVENVEYENKNEPELRDARRETRGAEAEAEARP